MKSALIAAAIFCIGLIVVAFFFASQDSGSGPRIVPLADAYSKRQQDEGWIMGSSDPKVRLVEYGDMQCAACAAVNPIIKEALQQNQDITQLTYRHYPLTVMHDKSMLAAEITEAAGRQGQFWQMQDLVFANQVTWAMESDSSLKDLAVQYASTLGLNVEQFKKDLNDSSLDDEINKDKRKGEDAGLVRAPSLFINGKLLEQIPATAEELSALIRKSAE